MQTVIAGNVSLKLSGSCAARPTSETPSYTGEPPNRGPVQTTNILKPTT